MVTIADGTSQRVSRMRSHMGGYNIYYIAILGFSAFVIGDCSVGVWTLFVIRDQQQ